jgi:hypothetical protein
MEFVNSQMKMAKLKNGIMNPLVAHAFFPHAPPLVHTVFVFLRQFAWSPAIASS